MSELVVEQRVKQTKSLWDWHKTEWMKWKTRRQHNEFTIQRRVPAAVARYIFYITHIQRVNSGRSNTLANKRVRTQSLNNTHTNCNQVVSTYLYLLFIVHQYMHTYYIHKYFYTHTHILTGLFSASRFWSFVQTKY